MYNGIFLGMTKRAGVEEAFAEVQAQQADRQAGNWSGSKKQIKYDRLQGTPAARANLTLRKQPTNIQQALAKDVNILENTVRGGGGRVQHLDRVPIAADTTLSQMLGQETKRKRPFPNINLFNPESTLRPTEGISVNDVIKARKLEERTGNVVRNYIGHPEPASLKSSVAPIAPGPMKPSITENLGRTESAIAPEAKSVGKGIMSRISSMPTWAKALAGTAGLAGMGGLAYAGLSD